MVFEEELSHLKWHLVGFSGVRRREKQQFTQKPGHLQYYRGDEETSDSRVGFMVHRRHVKNVMKMISFTSRFVYLTLNVEV